MPLAHYHAARQSEPANFVRFVTKKNQGGSGIDFILGFTKDGQSSVQSIRFDKSKFTAHQAKSWLQKHGFKTSVESVNEGNMELSFNSIRSLVGDAVRKKFTSSEGYQKYYVNYIWSEQALLRKEYYGAEDDPSYLLVDYIIERNEADTANIANIGEPRPARLIAMPIDGNEQFLLDESQQISWEYELEEAGKRNSKNDVSRLNTVLQTIMNLMSPDDIDDATHDAIDKTMKARQMHKNTKKESVEKNDNNPIDNDLNFDLNKISVVSEENTVWEELKESFTTPLAEAKIDKKNLVIKDTVILGPISLNGRIYPATTQEKAKPLFEGAKAYLNHPKIGDIADARQVQDLIGEHKNIRTVGEKTVSDLYLVDTPLVREWVIPIAESKPHLFGNSIVARGKMIKDKSGKVVVEEILAVRSVDVVAEPATTKGLFESKNFAKMEDDMDLKEITLEMLKEHRSDLIDTILASAKEKQEVEDLKKQLANLTTENKAKDTKIAEFEIKEAKTQKFALISALVREAKLPDKVKYEEKDGKQVIKKHFLSLLERCENEDEMKAIVEGWVELYQDHTEKPVSTEKKLDLSEGKKDVRSAEVLDRLHSALVH